MNELIPKPTAARKLARPQVVRRRWPVGGLFRRAFDLVQGVGQPVQGAADAVERIVKLRQFQFPAR